MADEELKLVALRQSVFAMFVAVTGAREGLVG